jgi:hypothetical protein
VILPDRPVLLQDGLLDVLERCKARSRDGLENVTWFPGGADGWAARVFETEPCRSAGAA